MIHCMRHDRSLLAARLRDLRYLSIISVAEKLLFDEDCALNLRLQPGIRSFIPPSCWLIRIAT